jgi:hypothetical protein
MGFTIEETALLLDHFRSGVKQTLHSRIILELRVRYLPGDQKGLFKLAVQLRKFFNSVIYNTATGYVLLVYLTNI